MINGIAARIPIIENITILLIFCCFSGDSAAILPSFITRLPHSKLNIGFVRGFAHNVTPEGVRILPDIVPLISHHGKDHYEHRRTDLITRGISQYMVKNSAKGNRKSHHRQIKPMLEYNVSDRYDARLNAEGKEDPERPKGHQRKSLSESERNQ